MKQTTPEGTTVPEINKEINTQILEKKELPNTPFHIIHEQDKGYFLTLGKYRLTDHKKTETEIIFWLENEKWNVILMIFQAILHNEISQIKNTTNGTN